MSHYNCTADEKHSEEAIIKASIFRRSTGYFRTLYLFRTPWNSYAVGRRDKDRVSDSILPKFFLPRQMFRFLRNFHPVFIEFYTFSTCFIKENLTFFSRICKFSLKFFFLLSSFSYLGSDLVSALTSLNVNDFPHFGIFFCFFIINKLHEFQL